MVDIRSTFSKSSSALKMGAAIMCIVFIIHVIGLSTNFWVYYEDNGIYEHRSGLWKQCYCINFLPKESCMCFWNPSMISGMPWFVAVQALECIGLVAVILTSLLVFLQLFVTPKREPKFWAVLCAIGGGLSIILGVGIYGGFSNGSYLSYSFGLSTAAGVLSLVASGLLILDKNNPVIPQQAVGHVQYNNQGQIMVPSTMGHGMIPLTTGQAIIPPVTGQLLISPPMGQIYTNYTGQPYIQPTAPTLGQIYQPPRGQQPPAVGQTY